jgi:hypothetical protein
MMLMEIQSIDSLTDISDDLGHVCHWGEYILRQSSGNGDNHGVHDKKFI